jgi:glycosyltransferase involved in cell wall biosynthesis
MRIAFWVRVGNKYGSLERYIALFAEQSTRDGHDFLLINEIENTSKEFCDRLQNAGVTQVVVGESVNSPVTVLIKTIQLLHKWKPDIVQLYFINSLAIPLLKICRIPLVYQTHLSGIEHDITFSTRLLRKIENYFSTRIFANSKRVRQDEICAGINPKRIEIVYLGISLRDFEEQDLLLQGPKPIGWNNENVRKIITIGRFFPVKGLRYVVESAIEVLQRREDVVWWFVGREGPESQVCNQLISNAGMQQRIQILGNRDDIVALLNQSEFQVVGSLSEGFGLMVLDAAACGVPTIGTRIGGLDETIVDGWTGLLVDVASPKALAKASLWLLNHPDELDRMGAEARKLVADKFDSEKLIRQLIGIFEQDYRNL